MRYGYENRESTTDEKLSILLNTKKGKFDGLILRDIFRKYDENYNKELTELQFKKLKLLKQIMIDYSKESMENEIITSAEQVFKYLHPMMNHKEQEEVGILFLDIKNRIVKNSIIFKGGVSNSICSPREIFKEALKYTTNSIIMYHNHVSGDPTPSRDDIEVTERISEAGELLGIKLLDHIIIGNSGFVSFRIEELIEDFDQYNRIYENVLR